MSATGVASDEHCMRSAERLPTACKGSVISRESARLMQDAKLTVCDVAGSLNSAVRGAGIDRATEIWRGPAAVRARSSRPKVQLEHRPIATGAADGGPTIV